MQRTIKFGKIDYNGTGRKINLVTLKINLEGEEKPVFTVSADVWNSKKTDILMGGQCLDNLLPYFKSNKLFVEIYRLWDLYHLNNLHAGTKRQEEFLKKFHIEDWADKYYETCEFLNKNNMLYDKGVKFGTTWHYWDIPKKDLEKIKKIILNMEA